MICIQKVFFPDCTGLEAYFFHLNTIQFCKLCLGFPPLVVSVFHFSGKARFCGSEILSPLESRSTAVLGWYGVERFTRLL